MNQICVKCNHRSTRETVFSTIIVWNKEDDLVRLDVEIDKRLMLMFVSMDYSSPKKQSMRLQDLIMHNGTRLSFVVEQYSGKLYSISTSCNDPFRCVKTVNDYLLTISSIPMFAKIRAILMDYEKQIARLICARIDSWEIQHFRIF